MSGSHTYAGKYPAQNERSGIHGISEREEQPDDISKMGKYEVCIPKSRILVQGILCEYKHTPRLQISNLIGDGRFYSLRLIDEMKKNLCAKCNAGLIADFAKQTGITFD